VKIGDSFGAPSDLAICCEDTSPEPPCHPRNWCPRQPRAISALTSTPRSLPNLSAVYSGQRTPRTLGALDWASSSSRHTSRQARPVVVAEHVAPPWACLSSRPSHAWLLPVVRATTSVGLARALAALGVTRIEGLIITGLRATHKLGSYV
jgi:hypothetical protein